MRPMITNGGPHPADKWADVTTDTILDLIQINEDSVSAEAAAARAAKRDLRISLFDLLNDHHSAVQTHEHGLKSAVKTVNAAEDHVAATLDPMPHVGPTLGKVKDMLAATPFAAHFAQPHVQDVLQNIIGQHTADVMHIERRWHQNSLSSKKGN